MVLHRCLAAMLACMLWLSGCSAASDPPAIPAASAQPSARPRLFYVGLALYSEAWSQNDVVELADELRRTSDFDVVPMIASNGPAASPRTYPLADGTAITSLLRTAAERAGPNDVVFVHISTHGGRGLLASKIGNNPPTIISAATLARALAPLGEHRTVIVLSACYSGSLIGALRAPSRIVITAARADRSSFGCAADSRHTFFGGAELEAFDERNRSLHQVFTTIRNAVARMEQQEDYRPSEPQIWVGDAASDLYEAPVF
jgi:hypothetical protein